MLKVTNHKRASASFVFSPQFVKIQVDPCEQNLISSALPCKDVYAFQWSPSRNFLVCGGCLYAHHLVPYVLLHRFCVSLVQLLIVEFVHEDLYCETGSLCIWERCGHYLTLLVFPFYSVIVISPQHVCGVTW